MKRILLGLMLIVTLASSALVFAKAHSTSPKSHHVMLYVLPGCQYCSEAERILESKGIKYHTSISNDGPVPKLYVDGHYKGTGVDAVQSWINQRN